MKIIQFPQEEIPSHIKYLDSVIDDLPENCIYNKVVTGAGATTIALENNQNYVICVPFTELIKNKTLGKSFILGVYKDVAEHKIKEYLNDHRIPTKKIMVTYDSLPKIVKLINPKDYKLLIDEYQMLFKQQMFRQKAVKGVLENYQLFKSFCFMTATMMSEEFIIKELENLPIYETKWANVVDVTIHSCEVKDGDTIHTTCFLINNYLAGIFEGNAHIFVNSVDFIKQVVKNCKLNDSNSRAIYSSHNKTEVGLIKGSTIDPIKKINFYTSSVWVGTDIKDKEGHIYIISDGKREHELVDVFTDIPQIIGRIRNTKYFDQIHHIYNPVKNKSNLSYEEYKKTITEVVERINEQNKIFNQMTLEARKSFVVAQTDNKKSTRKEVKIQDETDYSKYFYYDNECFRQLDENMLMYDFYNYKLTKHTYKMKVLLDKEYLDNGYKMTMFSPTEEVTKITNKKTKINKVSVISPKENLKENILKLKEILSNPWNKDDSFKHWVYQKYDYLEDAINYLGFDKIEELKYNIGNIKHFINRTKNTSDKDQLKYEIQNNSVFKINQFYTLAQIKYHLTEIYSRLDIKDKVFSNALLNYFECKKTTKYTKGKSNSTSVIQPKLESGFLILNLKN